MKTLSKNLIKKITDYFKNSPVLRAWLFGSYSRGEEKEDSDVDILVQFDPQAGVSLLRHAKIYLDLKKILNKEVDLVTDGTLMPYAQETADRDKILIYERESKR